MHIDLSAISLGAYASPLLMQMYDAFGLFSTICQNGYLIIPGVFSIFVHQLLNGAQSWYIRWRIIPHAKLDKYCL